MNKDELIDSFLMGACMVLAFMIQNVGIEEALEVAGIDKEELDRLLKEGMVESDYEIISSYLKPHEESHFE